MTTLSFSGNSAQAADSGSLADTLTFSGRWDLRTPGRALTVNSGSYFRARFSGTAVTAKFDLALNKPALPTIAWRIDDGDWQESEIGAEVKLAEGLPNGEHAVWLIIRGIDEHQHRWAAPLVGSVTFRGLTLSDGGKLLPPLEAWTKPALKIEFLGDSITEGVLVQPTGRGPDKQTWPWKSDAVHTFAARTAMALNAEWRQVGFGATGLAHGGSGGAESALKAFNFFHDDCPRDDWQPDLVVINQGTNDSKMPEEQYEPLYAQYLALVRQAYPKAKIVALCPFGGFQAAAIKDSVTKARAKGDNAVYYIDTTGWYTRGPLHPSGDASVVLAEKLVAALKAVALKP